MNILKLSLSVSISYFLLVSCGSDSAKSASSPIKIKTIEQVKEHLFVLDYILHDGALEIPSGDAFGIVGNRRPGEKRTIECDQGSVDLKQTQIDKSFEDMLEYHKCTLNDITYNGTAKRLFPLRKYMTGDLDASTIWKEEYSNFTTKFTDKESEVNLIQTNVLSRLTNFSVVTTTDGTYKLDKKKGSLTFSNFASVGPLGVKSVRNNAYNGKITIDTHCENGSDKGTYIVETVKELHYKARHAMSSRASGIIKLNSVTFTYDDPYVHVQVGDENKTFTIDTLLDFMQTSVEEHCLSPFYTPHDAYEFRGG